MPIIKPLETEYQGYRFRSRLEARWAVFYDVLRIPWEYEPQGFDLSSANLGWYLPDFWLPTQRYLIEIKAEYPTDEQTEKLRLVAETMRATQGLIFFGPISRLDYSESAILCHPGWDCGYCWCICSYCSALGIQFNGRSERLPCNCSRLHSNRHYTGDDPRIISAYEFARKARF
jgi:hypothetical protein